MTNEGTRPFAESSLEAQLITGQPDPPDRPGFVLSLSAPRRHSPLSGCLGDTQGAASEMRLSARCQYRLVTQDTPDPLSEGTAYSLENRRRVLPCVSVLGLGILLKMHVYLHKYRCLLHMESLPSLGGALEPSASGWGAPANTDPAEVAQTQSCKFENLVKVMGLWE